MGDLTKRAMLERILTSVGVDLETKVDQILATLTAPRLLLRVGPVATRTLSQQGPPNMALTLTDIQHVSASIQEVDAAGNPVPNDFPTPPTWASSDSTILTVTPAADGLSADVATTGKLGNAQVTVQGVTGSGRSIQGIGDITVVTSEATTVAISFGTPADK